jgi:hypothetical protein
LLLISVPLIAVFASVAVLPLRLLLLPPGEKGGGGDGADEEDDEDDEGAKGDDERGENAAGMDNGLFWALPLLLLALLSPLSTPPPSSTLKPRARNSSRPCCDLFVFGCSFGPLLSFRPFLPPEAVASTMRLSLVVVIFELRLDSALLALLPSLSPRRRRRLLTGESSSEG